MVSKIPATPYPYPICIPILTIILHVYCEAQARVRQGEARMVKGERPLSLNPCLELIVYLMLMITLNFMFYKMVLVKSKLIKINI